MSESPVAHVPTESDGKWQQLSEEISDYLLSGWTEKRVQDMIDYPYEKRYSGQPPRSAACLLLRDRLWDFVSAHGIRPSKGVSRLGGAVHQALAKMNHDERAGFSRRSIDERSRLGAKILGSKRRATKAEYQTAFVVAESQASAVKESISQISSRFNFQSFKQKHGDGDRYFIMSGRSVSSYMWFSMYAEPACLEWLESRGIQYKPSSAEIKALKERVWKQCGKSKTKLVRPLVTVDLFSALAIASEFSRMLWNFYDCSRYLLRVGDALAVRRSPTPTPVVESAVPVPRAAHVRVHGKRGRGVRPRKATGAICCRHRIDLRDRFFVNRFGLMFSMGATPLQLEGMKRAYRMATSIRSRSKLTERGQQLMQFAFCT
jgi:hypothetical protein